MSGATAAGECDGPVPSFREAVASARRVVIGDVVAVHAPGRGEPTSEGWSSRFTLRVRYVPRGGAPAVMEIRDLPTQPCAGWVSARTGDRIALAFDAIAFDPGIQVNTVAWIRGTPWSFTGVETTTVPDAYKLLGLDPPDTSVVSREPPREVPVGLLLVAAAGSLGAVVSQRRFRSGT